MERESCHDLSDLSPLIFVCLPQLLGDGYSGSVDNAEQKLWIDSKDEHDCDWRQQGEPFAKRQILHGGPSLIQRSRENPLKNRENEDRRCERANDGKCGRPCRQRECTSEDQEFADEAVQSRQAKG